MKFPILAPATNSGTLKEEFLRCFGLRVSNETKLREVVRDLAGAGVSKKTLSIWAVEAGYAKTSVSSLLSNSSGPSDRGNGGKEREESLQPPHRSCWPMLTIGTVRARSRCCAPPCGRARRGAWRQPFLIPPQSLLGYHN
jgi:hypothetical protein